MDMAKYSIYTSLLHAHILAFRCACDSDYSYHFLKYFAMSLISQHTYVSASEILGPIDEMTSIRKMTST